MTMTSNTSIQIKQREHNAQAAYRLTQNKVHPLLAKLFSSRGIQNFDDIDLNLSALLPPLLLENAEQAAKMLAEVVEKKEEVIIIGDYDCDGATSTALAVRALGMLGLKARYLVPDRFKFGYGLTPAIVDLLLTMQPRPQWIITVDNGMASDEGVEYAKQFGIQTIITDHHLPAEKTPRAVAIVNPNQKESRFPSKNLAGVGVVFYVMLALRAQLRLRGFFKNKVEPNFKSLLDLVALGTVADLVPLDHNNRILVAHGLRNIRQGALHIGLQKMFEVAGISPFSASVEDLSFRIAPRLNAAGRIDHMQIGVECLITDDIAHAAYLAQRLSDLNYERQSIERKMKLEAQNLIAQLPPMENQQTAFCLLGENWHEGVVGLLASHLVKKYHLPAFVFGKAQEEGLIKGSGRSVPGLHLRDTLDLIEKASPGILCRFGGHAMAAGLTLRLENFERFKTLFFQLVAQNGLLGPKIIETDGALSDDFFNIHVAKLLNNQVWGQGFPAPLFEGIFDVQHQQVLKEKHLKMQVLAQNKLPLQAIFFNAPILNVPAQVRLIYKLGLNSFRGVESLSLMVEHLECV